MIRKTIRDEFDNAKFLAREFYLPGHPMLRFVRRRPNNGLQGAHSAQPLSTLRLAEANVFFMRATEAIFPGISLWGTGLQEVLAKLGPYVHVSAEVIGPLTKWLRDVLRDFGAKQENALHYFAVEPLALVYCLSLLRLMQWGSANPDGRTKRSNFWKLFSTGLAGCRTRTWETPS